MQAHKLAVELGCGYVSTSALMLALLQEHSELAERAKDLGITESTLTQEMNKDRQVAPTGATLQMSGLTSFVLECLSKKFTEEKVRPEHIFDALVPESSIPSTPRHPEMLGPLRPVRHPQEWLGPEVAEVLQMADKIAGSEGCAEIRPEHLMAASADALDWLPEQLRVKIHALRPVHIASEQTEDLSLDADAVGVMCKAREHAKCLASDRIQAEHILYCTLRLVNEALVREFIQVRKSMCAANDAKPTEPVRETRRISMTKRAVQMLKDVSAKAGANTPLIAHYIESLFKESQESEVPFIADHTNEIEQAIANMRGKDESVPIRTLLVGAIAHGLRLGSSYIDINHLGLALLDYEIDSVDLAVDALVSRDITVNRRKYALRQRLERCIAHQRFQGVSDALVVVDLDDLDSI